MVDSSDQRTRLSFRPLAEADLDTVSEWLRAAHVRRWWRDPADIAAVREKYLPRILGEEPTEVFVITMADEPLGLIQRYRFSDYGTWAATVAGTSLSFPAAAGIDYMIGVAEHTGRGLGTEVISSFTDRLFTEFGEVQTIVGTPQRANRASCRALEKSGYELAWVGRLDSDDPADADDAAIYVKHRPIEETRPHLDRLGDC